jgi:hypothetical protein
MNESDILRPLLPGEREQLRSGLRSSKAFTLRRCQILLAVDQGRLPSQIVQALGCARATVMAVFRDFNARGVACVHEERKRENAARRGCPRVEEKQPGIIGALERLLAGEIAGDPMSEKKWVRVTLFRLTQGLRAQGYRVVEKTVRRLLVDLSFSMKANKRRQVRSHCPERDEQFGQIAAQRESFAAGGLPVISVDTKKKELIGPFRNGGRVWCKEAEEVDEHDFPSAAECQAAPFGVYDLAKNAGYVVVGTSHNTPEFTVKSIAGWWASEGRAGYPSADRLLILADGGGGNGSRSKAWLLNLQVMLCDRFGLTVSVCHYPPGCSKWNPVERRLFSYISMNWAGKPLRSLGVMLAYIRGTSTQTGLRVTASLDEETYRKGQKVSREEVQGLSLKRHDVYPQWNYTLSPRVARVSEGA